MYGYDNVEIASSVLDAYGRPKRDHVERRINEEQASVVCRIFHLCAEGKGMVSIARLLNDAGLPAPRNSQGRPVFWSPSSVRSLLFRRLYLGEVVWNKSKKRNPWGMQQQRKRPEKDWVKIPAPHLQIVSEAEWKGRRQALLKQISTVDAENKRLVSAISAGGDIPALVEALKAANERKDTLLRELATVNGYQHSDADYEQLEKDLQAHFEASWKTILTRQVASTRQILCKLFNGNRLPLYPLPDAGSSQYEFKGTAAIGRLVTGRAKALVSPTGFEPVLLP